MKKKKGVLVLVLFLIFLSLSFVNAVVLNPNCGKGTCGIYGGSALANYVDTNCGGKASGGSNANNCNTPVITNINYFCEGTTSAYCTYGSGGSTSCSGGSVVCSSCTPKTCAQYASEGTFGTGLANGSCGGATLDCACTSGGTNTTSGAYTYHTFTSNGNFVINKNSLAIDVLVVGAGGGSGKEDLGDLGTAGGGGKVSTYSIVANTGTKAIVIGAGGIGNNVQGSVGGNGGISSFNGTYSAVGGKGGPGTTTYGGNSGSGNSGGAGGYLSCGGAGGNGAVGFAGTDHVGGAGGAGTSVWGNYYGGGGGGAGRGGGGFGFGGGAGGSGGGGTGAAYQPTTTEGTAGKANTGGGAGGGFYGGLNGGSGIVIVRYLTADCTSTPAINSGSWKNSSGADANLLTLGQPANLNVLGANMVGVNINYTIYNSTGKRVYNFEHTSVSSSVDFISWTPAIAGNYSFNATLVSNGKSILSGILSVNPIIVIPTCSNLCTPNSTTNLICSGNNVMFEKCVDETNGCLNWTAPVLNKTCSASQTCSNGLCQDVAYAIPESCFSYKDSSTCGLYNKTVAKKDVDGYLFSSFSIKSMPAGGFCGTNNLVTSVALFNGICNYTAINCACAWTANCGKSFDLKRTCTDSAKNAVGTCEIFSLVENTCGSPGGKIIQKLSATWKVISGDSTYKPEKGVCESKDTSYECPTTQKLPFFGFWNFVLGLSLVAVIYAFLNRK